MSVRTCGLLDSLRHDTGCKQSPLLRVASCSCSDSPIVLRLAHLRALVNVFPKLANLRFWVGYKLSAAGIAQALLPLKNTLEVLDIQCERVSNPEDI